MKLPGWLHFSITPLPLLRSELEIPNHFNDCKCDLSAYVIESFVFHLFLSKTMLDILNMTISDHFVHHSTNASDISSISYLLHLFFLENWPLPVLPELIATQSTLSSSGLKHTSLLIAFFVKTAIFRCFDQKSRKLSKYRTSLGSAQRGRYFLLQEVLNIRELKS